MELSGPPLRIPIRGRYAIISANLKTRYLTAGHSALLAIAYPVVTLILPMPCCEASSLMSCAQCLA